MTNLTPAQLEQFESTFRYFDKDETNTLNLSEMAAALASLGLVYSDYDMNYIYEQLTEDYGAVTYEAFINLLVGISAPQVIRSDCVCVRLISPKIRRRRSSCARLFMALRATR